MLHWALLQLLAVLEGIAHTLTETDIAEVNGIKSDEAQFLHIRLAIFSEELLLAKHVHNLCYDIVTGLALVVFMLDAALQRHRKYIKYRSIHIRSLLSLPAGLLHLIGGVLGRYDTDEIRCHERINGSKSNGVAQTTA